MRLALVLLVTSFLVSCSPRGNQPPEKANGPAENSRASNTATKQPDKSPVSPPDAARTNTNPAKSPAAGTLIESATLKAELIRVLPEMGEKPPVSYEEMANQLIASMRQGGEDKFLMVTPEVEQQLAKGIVDEAAAQKRIDQMTAKLVKTEREASALAVVLLKTPDGKKSTGIRLELASRVLESTSRALAKLDGVKLDE